MAGGRDGEKFSDAFNDPEDRGNDRVGHVIFKTNNKRLFLFVEDIQDGFVFQLALLDFELAENRLKSDVDFVPMVFQGAHIAFVAVAQITERRRGTDQGMNLLARGRRAFHRRADNFQFLHNNGFYLQELIVIFFGELLAAGDIDEVIELLPALQVVLQLDDELIQIFVAHNSASL
jgi:hypothetical protein